MQILESHVLSGQSLEQAEKERTWSCKPGSIPMRDNRADYTLSVCVSSFRAPEKWQYRTPPDPQTAILLAVKLGSVR